VQALPEDVGHEAVDEEVGRRVQDHGQLRAVAQQQYPQWQVVAVVLQLSLELLNGKNLEHMLRFSKFFRQKNGDKIGKFDSC
jgi:hypothetical protein